MQAIMLMLASDRIATVCDLLKAILFQSQIQLARTTFLFGIAKFF